MTCATAARQWAAVGRKWRDDLPLGARAIIPKKYIQHLLAYENHLSDGAQEREISHSAKPAAAKKSVPASKAGRPVKRPKPSKASLQSLYRQGTGRVLKGHGEVCYSAQTEICGWLVRFSSLQIQYCRSLCWHEKSRPCFLQGIWTIAYHIRCAQNQICSALSGTTWRKSVLHKWALPHWNSHWGLYRLPRRAQRTQMRKLIEM